MIASDRLGSPYESEEKHHPTRCGYFESEGGCGRLSSGPESRRAGGDREDCEQIWTTAGNAQSHDGILAPCRGELEQWKITVRAGPTRPRRNGSAARQPRAIDETERCRPLAEGAQSCARWFHAGAGD